MVTQLITPATFLLSLPPEVWVMIMVMINMIIVLVTLTSAAVAAIVLYKGMTNLRCAEENLNQINTSLERLEGLEGNAKSRLDELEKAVNESGSGEEDWLH